MPLNQFTTQSGWASITSDKSETINIVSTGAYISPAFDSWATTQYNLSYGGGMSINVNGLAGIYLLNCSFTTSGASNDTLACRISYSYTDSGTQTITGHEVQYDSKGAKRWSVNQSTIMQIKNTEDGIFFPSFANLSNTNDITLYSFIMNAIKLY